jgi:hypothetical protein
MPVSGSQHTPSMGDMVTKRIAGGGHTGLQCPVATSVLIIQVRGIDHNRDMAVKFVAVS